MTGEARSPQVEMPQLAIVDTDAQKFADRMIYFHRKIVNAPDALVIRVSAHVMEMEVRSRERGGLILHAMQVTTGASVAELEAAGLTGRPPRSVYRQVGVIHPDGGMKFGIEDRYLLTSDLRKDPFVTQIIDELQQHFSAS